VNSNAELASKPLVALSQQVIDPWYSSLVAMNFNSERGNLELKTYICGHYFCNRNTLALTSRNSSDELVTNESVFGMSNLESGRNNMKHFFYMLHRFPLFLDVPGNPVFDCKANSFGNC
jgi:hypothetical protein